VGVAAYALDGRVSRWRDDTLFLSSRPDSSRDTLAPAGSLRVALPPGASGLLHFDGLTTFLRVDSQAEVLVPYLPGGWRGAVRLARPDGIDLVVDPAAKVLPGQLDSAGFTRSRAAFRLDLPGGLSEGLPGVPVLVRLDSSWHGFDATLPDGSDLRLTTADGRSLPLVVASWDRHGRVGALWTWLDSVQAPGDSVDLELEWGLPVAAGSGVPVFSSTAGWMGAWPLGDSGSVALDRLGANPGVGTGTGTVPGVVGRASRFDGVASNVVVRGGLARGLSVPEGGPYTLSCWARLGSTATNGHLAGFGFYGDHLQFKATFSPFAVDWFAKDYRTSPAGGDYVLWPADSGRWTHLAMTLSGDSLALFVDGIRRSLSSGFNVDIAPRRLMDFAMGAAVDTTGIAQQFFQGDLAEVWLQSVARSPEWIRFTAANQAPGASIARFR
jgi:hypothetical protein